MRLFSPQMVLLSIILIMCLVNAMASFALTIDDGSGNDNNFVYPGQKLKVTGFPSSPQGASLTIKATLLIEGTTAVFINQPFLPVQDSFVLDYHKTTDQIVRDRRSLVSGQILREHRVVPGFDHIPVMPIKISISPSGGTSVYESIFYVISRCDYLQHIDKDPKICYNNAECHPSTLESPSYCECNPDVISIDSITSLPFSMDCKIPEIISPSSLPHIKVEKKHLNQFVNLFTLKQDGEEYESIVHSGQKLRFTVSDDLVSQYDIISEYYTFQNPEISTSDLVTGDHRVPLFTDLYFTSLPFIVRVVFKDKSNGQVINTINFPTQVIALNPCIYMTKIMTNDCPATATYSHQIGQCMTQSVPCVAKLAEQCTSHPEFQSEANLSNSKQIPIDKIFTNSPQSFGSFFAVFTHKTYNFIISSKLVSSGDDSIELQAPLIDGVWSVTLYYQTHSDLDSSNDGCVYTGEITLLQNFTPTGYSLDYNPVDATLILAPSGSSTSFNPYYPPILLDNQQTPILDTLVWKDSWFDQASNSNHIFRPRAKRSYRNNIDIPHDHEIYFVATNTEVTQAGGRLMTKVAIHFAFTLINISPQNNGIFSGYVSSPEGPIVLSPIGIDQIKIGQTVVDKDAYTVKPFFGALFFFGILPSFENEDGVPFTIAHNGGTFSQNIEISEPVECSTDNRLGLVRGGQVIEEINGDGTLLHLPVTKSTRFLIDLPRPLDATKSIMYYISNNNVFRNHIPANIGENNNIYTLTFFTLLLQGKHHFALRVTSPNQLQCFYTLPNPVNFVLDFVDKRIPLPGQNIIYLAVDGLTNNDLTDIILNLSSSTDQIEERVQISSLNYSQSDQLLELKLATPIIINTDYTLTFQYPNTQPITLSFSTYQLVPQEYQIFTDTREIAVTWSYPTRFSANHPGQPPYIVQFFFEISNSDDSQPPYISEHLEITILEDDGSRTKTMFILENYNQFDSNIRLKLPNLPTSIFNSADEFSIVMKTVNVAVEDQVLYPDIRWTIRSIHWVQGQCRYPCPASYECNQWNDRCEPKHPNKQISQWLDQTRTTNQCILPCPRYFTQNLSCTQCVCTNTDCHKYTKSVQVSLKTDQQGMGLLSSDDYATQGFSLFYTHIRHRLITALELNTVNFDLGFDKDRKPIGVEDLFVSVLNPNTKILHFDAILVTFIITPNNPTTSVGTSDASINEQIKTRFDQIMQKLISLKDDGIELSRSSLGMKINISAINRIDYNNPLQRTVCTASVPSDPTTTTTTGTSKQPIQVVDKCPLPTPILLQKSPFWSRCEKIYQTNAHRLHPKCYDYANKELFGDVCSYGYHDYPSVVEAPCDIPVKPTLEWDLAGMGITSPPPSSNSPPQLLSVKAGSSLLLRWKTNTTSPLITVKVLLYLPGSHYHIPLGNFVAMNSMGLVVIPTDISTDISNAVIQLRCDQYNDVATLRTASSGGSSNTDNQILQLNISGFNLCTTRSNDNNGDDGDGNGQNNTVTVDCSDKIGQSCNPKTGQCECNGEKGWYLSEQRCVLPCTSQCGDDNCSELTPNQCSSCPQGKALPFCQYDISCQNDAKTGLSTMCNNNGSSHGTDCTKCTCSGNWQGDHCDVCQLTDQSSTLPVEQRCNQQSTDLTATRNNNKCKSCVCIPGYTGKTCDQPILRGSLVFVKDNETNQFISVSISRLLSPDPQSSSFSATSFSRSNNNNNNNIVANAMIIPQDDLVGSGSDGDDGVGNGLDLLTDLGRAHLINDLASSLGVDSEYVNVNGIIQADDVGLSSNHHNNNNIIVNSTNKLHSMLFSSSSTSLSTASSPSTTTQSRPKPLQTSPQPPPTTTIVTFSLLPSPINRSNGVNSLDDLNTAWGGLQDDFDTARLPIHFTDSAVEIGNAKQVDNAQLPDVRECDPLWEVCDCTGDDCDNDSSTNIGLIIGVVVAVIVIVILLFVLTIVIVQWCKKNQRGCFNKGKRSTRSKNGGVSGGSGTTTTGGGGSSDNVELTMNTTTNNINNSNTGLKDGTVASGTAIDLIEITDHGERLPSGWSKQKHKVTGDVFYVNQHEMISQRHSPNSDDKDAGGLGW